MHTNKDIKIHVFHTGTVCVAPDLPFGGEILALFECKKMEETI